MSPVSGDLISFIKEWSSIVAPHLGFLSPETRESFMKRNLVTEMKYHNGCKRIRKKKAKSALARRWLARIMAHPISHRVNYSEMARQMFKVESLPPPTVLTHQDGE